MSVILVPAKISAESRKRTKHIYECGKALATAVRRNRSLFILSLIFLLGMTLGALYARSVGYTTLEKMDFLFAGNFKARMAQPFLSVFTASFASAFIFISACFLCGLSMWGICLIPLILCFRGFGLGLTSGYLYATYTWKGILYSFAIIMPGAFVCCLSILLASLEGIRFSRSLTSEHKHKSMMQNGISFQTYLLRYGIILIGTCAAAGMDLLLFVCFGSLFSF